MVEETLRKKWDPSDSSRGLECRHCGCKDFRVVYNYIVEYRYPGSSSVGASSSSSTDWGWVGSDANAISPGQNVIIEVSYDATRVATGQWEFFVDGLDIGHANNPNNYTTLHTNSESLFVGKQGWYSPMNSDSLLSEVLLYETTLDNNTRDATGKYLAEKYGISSYYDVPEPAALSLLALGGLALLRRKRK